MMMQYNAEVRVATELLWAGQPVPDSLVSHCDSLQYLLYTDTVSVPLRIQVISRISAESYNIASQNGKANYKQLAMALNSCKDAPAFYDNFFLFSAVSLGDNYLAMNNNRGALVSYLRALKSAIHEKNVGKYNDLIPGIHLKIAYGDACIADYDNSAVWQQKYLREVATDDYLEQIKKLATLQRMVDDEASGNYFEALLSAAMSYNQVNNKPKVIECLDLLFGEIESENVDLKSAETMITLLNYYYVDSSYSDKFLYLVKEKHDPRNIQDNAILAKAYQQVGDMANAVKMANLVNEMFNDTDLSNDEYYASILSSIEMMYTALNEYDNAIKYAELAISYMEDHDEIPKELIDNSKKILASYYSMNGDYVKSQELINQLLNKATDNEEFTIELKLSAINNYLASGKYDAAEKECNLLLSQTLTNDQLWEVLTLKTAALISLIDSAYDRNSPALQAKIDELNQTIQITDQLVSTAFPDDAEKRLTQLFHSGTSDFITNKKDGLIAKATEMESLINEEFKSSYLHDTYLSMNALYFLKGGKYDKVINMIQNVDANPSTIGKVYDLQVLAEASLNLGKMADAQSYYKRMAEVINAAVNEEFMLLSEQDKESYWQMYERQIADAGRYADEENPASDFGGVVYDLALNSKGLLLSSNKTFWNKVKNSSNAEVAELVKVRQNSRKKLNEDLAMSPEEREALISQIKSIEESLARLMDKDDTMMRKYKWQDVKDKLKKNDVAIEFLELQDIDYSRSYGAIVVATELPNPVFLNIGNINEIDSIVRNQNDATLLWQKLMPYMKPGGNVYFSAAGNLHCLPIESLFDSSPYRMYRLSSTRQLLNTDEWNGTDVALFGGIDYGSTNPKTNSATRGTIHSLQGLPGTLTELQNISTLLDQTGLNYTSFVGSEGSEQNFRELSGKPVKLLHIGTHGYYLPSSDGKKSRMPYSLQRFYSSVGEAHDPLVENGLFFAGANQTAGKKTSNDGIVTALEISDLDFSNVDLVVLSACQSGLGTLSGDGVFGLQRGLKLSGVNSILMTLDKVNDQITCDFITKFYSDLLAGKTKVDALENAKQYVREKYPDSSTWHSFILLDALD